MKKIIILISLMISFLVFAETNTKDGAKAEEKANPKIETKSGAKAGAKANPKIETKANAKVNPKADNKDNPGNNSIKYSKVITVHGMVCAFCSNSLEKKFKKEEAIDHVKVELKNKKVSVRFKKGKSIEDEKLKEIITSSGFKVMKIESVPNSG